MRVFFLLGALLVANTLAAEDQSGSARFDIRQLRASVTSAMCFKTGENTQGMNKICYYDCLGSPAAITIGAVQLCPLTINR